MPDGAFLQVERPPRIRCDHAAVPGAAAGVTIAVLVLGVGGGLCRPSKAPAAPPDHRHGAGIDAGASECARRAATGDELTSSAASSTCSTGSPC
jgi:hypothetical protein